MASATVIIRFAEPLTLSGAMGSEGFSVRSTEGVGGLIYLLQVATNLDMPTSWETVATNMAATNGVIQFLDPAATNAPARYYRVVIP